MADCKDGDRGPMGLQGATGATGASGAVGKTGPQGPQAIRGLTGAQGPQGAKGAKGDTGKDGVKGFSGIPGADGLDGAVGKAGASGLDGTDGADGPQGAIGPTGLKGATGLTGLTGATGAAGTNGMSFEDSFQAEGEPLNVNSVTPALGDTDLCDVAAVLQTITEVYDDGGNYDHTTGIWTVGTTGRYDISFFASMTILTGWSNGRVRVGISHPTTCVFYCVNAMEISNKVERAQVSGAAFGIELTAGDQLALKIVNASTTNYITVSGDVVRLTARKVG